MSPEHSSRWLRNGKSQTACEIISYAYFGMILINSIGYALPPRLSARYLHYLNSYKHSRALHLASERIDAFGAVRQHAYRPSFESDATIVCIDILIQAQP